MSIPKADQPLPTGDDKAAAVQTLFDTIAPRYDLVNRLMTFGLDVMWRRATLRAARFAAGDQIADLACGTGDFCRELTKSGQRPVGFDFSLGMLTAARTDAPLVQCDAQALPLPRGSMDGATCGYALRNFVDLETFFAELARVVRPGGRIALLDVGTPSSKIIGAGYNVYFGKIVPKIGALLSDGDAYGYLPRSVAYLPPIPVLIAGLEAAGFAEVEHRELSRGLSQLIVGTRRIRG